MMNELSKRDWQRAVSLSFGPSRKLAFELPNRLFEFGEVPAKLETDPVEAQLELAIDAEAVLVAEFSPKAGRVELQSALGKRLPRRFVPEPDKPVGDGGGRSGPEVFFEEGAALTRLLAVGLG